MNNEKKKIIIINVVAITIMVSVLVLPDVFHKYNAWLIYDGMIDDFNSIEKNYESIKNKHNILKNKYRDTIYYRWANDAFEETKPEALNQLRIYYALCPDRKEYIRYYNIIVSLYEEFGIKSDADKIISEK